MIKIAEMLPPEHSAHQLWRVIRQAGVRHAVGGLPPATGLSPGEQPWDYLPLLRLQQQYESFGFRLAVLESRPPYNLAKRGLPGRDEEIDAICVLIENLGRLGIPVWCYEWMADFNWLRTNTAIESRGGSLVSGYDHALLADAPPAELGPLTEEELWTNLEYFLRRVVPVAERWNVRLAMHPDDPPLSPIRGVGRIMRSVENYERLLDLVPSPVNGITLCQGNFRLMTDDIPAVIRRFAERIFFVHLRDVRGTVRKFEETWHDDGPTDLLECLRAYREVGYHGVLRPDHVPTVDGDSNDRPGYSIFGRLFAVGYLRGLQQAAYADVPVGERDGEW
ncbi:mannonate dehydratase [Plantactinospora soyae]|uniref:mannonate dehydratase n=1 Tax=Plantactinospora soyae TaxID=1544732 RepID=A0A927M6J7_9ACTN|nr:mannonate dehydratase [Plantactinospora soyae]MBE1485395.1 mannonate dehydratase [Plantactinospora soyae]